MDLVRKVNSTYGQVNRNLQILEREGIVNTQYYIRRTKVLRAYRYKHIYNRGMKNEVEVSVDECPGDLYSVSQLVSNSLREASA